MGYHTRVPKKDLRGNFKFERLSSTPMITSQSYSHQCFGITHTGEAELHFKLSCALQFNQDPDAALQAVTLVR